MTDVAKRLVRCPHCSTQMRVSTKKPVIYCPKCKGAIDLQKQPQAAAPAEPFQAPQEGETAETAARSLGEYLKLYWRMARGGWILPMFFATLAAIALSFFKPLIGARGILGVGGAVAALFVLSSLAFVIGRSAAYLIRRRQVVSEEATSHSAWLAYASIVTLLFPFAPLAAVEAWGPAEGQLARNVPSLKRTQEEIVQAVDRVGLLHRLSLAIRGTSNAEPAIEVADRAGKPETSASAATGDYTAGVKTGVTSSDAAGGRREERDQSHSGAVQSRAETASKADHKDRSNDPSLTAADVRAVSQAPDQRGHREAKAAAIADSPSQDKVSPGALGDAALTEHEQKPVIQKDQPNDPSLTAADVRAVSQAPDQRGRREAKAAAIADSPSQDKVSPGAPGDAALTEHKQKPVIQKDQPKEKIGPATEARRFTQKKKDRGRHVAHRPSTAAEHDHHIKQLIRDLESDQRPADLSKPAFLRHSRAVEAVDNLKDLGAAAIPAVPALTWAALNDPSTYVKRKANEVLGNIRVHQAILATCESLTQPGGEPEIVKAAEASLLKQLPAVGSSLMPSTAFILYDVHRLGNKRLSPAIESAWEAAGFKQYFTATIKYDREHAGQEEAEARKYAATHGGKKQPNLRDAPERVMRYVMTPAPIGKPPDFGEWRINPLWGGGESESERRAKEIQRQNNERAANRVR